MSYNPWDHLSRTSLALDRSRDLGFIDGLLVGGTIFLHRTLSRVEQWCTLAHELVHYELGHDGPQTPHVEAAVKSMTARRLIPYRHLLDAARWSMCSWEAADHLNVTEDVLTDRLSTLAEWQIEQLQRGIA